MRLVDMEKTETYIPGNISTYPSYYHTFGGYYYRNWSFNRTPDYYSTTRTYTVETNVFSIKEDKIIWTGVTQTTDPSGVNRLTEEVAKVVYKKMMEEGLSLLKNLTKHCFRINASKPHKYKLYTNNLKCL